MDTVKVDKEKLLNILKENRQKHVDTFDKVMEAYRDKSIELLEEHIERIKSGAVEKVAVALPAPENYEEEYDRAIAMVEWHEDDIIKLESYEFDCWVRDQWRWKDNFVAMSQTYNVR